ncbi:MAG: hypothetical protein CMI53_03655 [Parcubacteria group bacterium]|nr:hypothetical protein [Parcubacteria group bacterium]|tara:strand:- start:201 stop:1076 length:876 start_codon:yes stop_codon:yes gene_type:complete
MELRKSSKTILNWITKPRKINLAQRIFFVQQLGVMIKAGISLSVALKTLANQTSSKTFKIVLIDLQQGVEKGNLLSKGLEKYQKMFGELFINMVKAGEASGKLEDVLKQLFVQMKKDHETISKVKGAMIYPAIVIVMMIGIGILVLVYVIPTMSGIFTEMQIELPLATRVLLGSSAFVLSYGIYLIIGFAILGVAINRVIATPKGRYTFHKLLLKLPVVGGIIRKINLARFARSMSSLLKTDIPIVQSFEITSRILGNVLYKEALMQSKEKIKKGISIQESLNPYINLFHQ